MRRLDACALVLMVASAACSDSPTGPTAGPDTSQLRLPAEMRLVASAQGRIDGLAITCALEFHATLRVAGDEMHGEMGGDAQRSRIAPDGSGEAFRADAYYPEIRIDVDRTGRARLRAFRNGVPERATGESRFWDALTLFDGTYDSTRQTIAGAWTCRPLDTRSDVSGDVTGTWSLQPLTR